MKIDQQEITDLDQRRTALHEYLKSDEFRALPPDVQDWRRQQEAAMEQYSRAMAEIQRLTPDQTAQTAPVAADAFQQPNEAPAANTAQRKAAQEPARTSKTADRKPTRSVKAKSSSRKAGRK